MAFQMTSMGAPMSMPAVRPMAQPPINFNISFVGGAGNPAQPSLMGQSSTMATPTSMDLPINFNITMAGAAGTSGMMTTTVEQVPLPSSSPSGIVEKFDRNQDGSLDLDEIVLGGGYLSMNPNRTAREEFEGNLLNTLINGGAAGTGLRPDANQDGLITQAEIDQLAAADGDGMTLGTNDFSAAFNEQGVYQPASVSAQGQQGFTQLMQGMLQLMTMMLGFMTQLFQR